MKQLATIGVVALLLLGAAIYLSTLNKSSAPQPITETPIPVVETKKGPQPITFAKADGTLTISTAISNGYLLQGSTRDMYAAIDVNALKHESGKRPPLNLAVVIDRSGSMSGDKIRHAKEAALRLINVLSPNDRVALVSYGSDVSVDFSSQPVTSANRQMLSSAINNIQIGGGTNLSGGFQRGFSEISRWKNAEAVNRVILMSDGHANIGITSMPELAALSQNALKTQVSVTTMGVGLDYNEDLMTRMANLGAGNYYFVDRSQQIVEYFNKELKGLASTVARNTSVVLTLAEGVELAELYGFAHQKSGRNVYISLAEFYSGQTKNVLMKLKADPGAVGEKPIYKVEMSYDDVVNGNADHESLALKSVTTADAKEVELGTNVDVIGRVQQIEVANTFNDAMIAYDAGDNVKAEKVLKRGQRVLRERKAKYKFKGAGRYEDADKEMEEMQQAIQAKPASSTEGRRLIKSKKARSNAIILADDLF